MVSLAERRHENAATSSEAASEPGSTIATHAALRPSQIRAERTELDGRELTSGLVEDGDLIVGAVALGGSDVFFLVSREIRRQAPAHDGPLHIAVSRTHPPAIVGQVAVALDAELVPMGSADVKIASVVTGESDVHIHGGGQYQWRSAAPVPVARAAELDTSRLDGSPLLSTQENPYLPDLVVCRPELSAQPRETIAIAERKASQ